MASRATSLEDKWADPRWRLNNLYKIKDKQGRAVDFRLNAAQEELFNSLHYLNVILKARQMGFTTFIQLFMLDACVFNSNTAAGVVAHTREDAEAFFKDKIKFAYDNLDPEIRRVVTSTQDSAKSLAFSNGSSIRVGTSLRSGTFQYLHVSEFGKLCARFPDKAREVVTGALNTIQAGQFAFIESTAEGTEGAFFDMCDRAQKATLQGKPLTAMDFKFHFHPWWGEPGYTLDAPIVLTKEQDAYFQKLADENDIHLTDGQEAWYVKKLESQGEDMKREFPSTPEEAFAAAIEGAYLSTQMATVRRQGRICRTPIESLPVDTFWDLGVNDDMCIWFRQKVGPEHRFIDYYANSGEGLEHYARVLKERDYLYGVHHLPHDGDARRLSFKAQSVRQMLTELGVKPCVVVPRIATEKSGIEASRRYLSRVWIDEARCAQGIKCLDNYRKEWDEERGVWKDRPRHDAASHGYKAFETAAVAVDWQMIEDNREFERNDDSRSTVTGY